MGKIEVELVDGELKFNLYQSLEIKDKKEFWEVAVSADSKDQLSPLPEKVNNHYQKTDIYWFPELKGWIAFNYFKFFDDDYYRGPYFVQTEQPPSEEEVNKAIQDNTTPSKTMIPYHKGDILWR
jgi:hypothetical protein